MGVLERRLRRLEVSLLPVQPTAESRRLHEIVMEIRRRAARLGLPEPEDLPQPDLAGMSLAEIILASRRRHRQAVEVSA